MRRNLIPFMRQNQQVILNAGIALVVVDCPTDQWGAPGLHPTACLDDYRSSRQHANDVRGILIRLTADHGITRFYVMGHSYGSVSSRWLAKHLGNEITGSIHSASINVTSRNGHGSSVPGFAYSTVAAPALHVHHANDACKSTPYQVVQGYAGDNLVTVYGGTPAGDPCEGRHLHSYAGREAAVVHAIIRWVKTRSVEKTVGEKSGA
jgi:hypothetical protein